jgi:RHS repeat-associated protein
MGCLKLNIVEEYDNLKVIFRSKNSAFLGDLDYYPFGMEMPGRGLNPTDYRFAYQGLYAEADAETGLSSFWLRSYDARIGQFTTTDPFGQGFSSYAGMGNNPVSLVDPTGGFEAPPTWQPWMIDVFNSFTSGTINYSNYERGIDGAYYSTGGGSGGGGGGVIGNTFAGNQDPLGGQSMGDYLGIDPLYALVIAGLISEEGYVEAGPLVLGNYGKKGTNINGMYFNIEWSKSANIRKLQNRSGGFFRKKLFLCEIF